MQIVISKIIRGILFACIVWHTNGIHQQAAEKSYPFVCVHVRLLSVFYPLNAVNVRSCSFFTVKNFGHVQNLGRTYTAQIFWWMYGRFTFCSVSMRCISVIHSLIVRLTSVYVRPIKLMKRSFTGEKTDTPFKFRTLTEFETNKTHEKRIEILRD